MKNYTTTRDGRKVTYSAETVGRALDRHQERGYIRSWREPFEGERKWAVDVTEYGYFEGTIREVHALVVGMTAVHRKHGREAA